MARKSPGRKTPVRKTTAKRTAKPKAKAPRKTTRRPTTKVVSVKAVEDIESASDDVRATARAALGITGKDEKIRLREGMKTAGVGWYPLLALGLLLIVDQFQGYAFFVLGPEISDGLGISK